MSKPKHPTSRSLRQGQTLYYLADDSLLFNKKRPIRIEKYFLHSHKIKDSPLGQIVDELSVYNLKRAIEKYRISTRHWFYSKKKAEAAVRTLENRF